MQTQDTPQVSSNADAELRKLDLARDQLEFDRAKWDQELAVSRDELALKTREFDANQRNRFSGITTAAIAALASLLAAGITAYAGGFFSLETQREKSAAELNLQGEKNRAEAQTRELDRRFQLVLKATENRTPDQAATNLLFFVDIGYLPDPDNKIRQKADRREVPVFTTAELTQSATAAQFGMDNTPPKEALEALNNISEKILVPVREHFGAPTMVVSGYRSPELNRKLGASETSAHLRGEAVDVVVTNIPPKTVACWIQSNLVYDDLMVEHDKWVHVSLKKSANKKSKPLELDANGTHDLACP
jgi:hypothetical protein